MNVTIVATDLNQPMLDVASSIGTSRPVDWRVADALHLPFDDATFDAVVCPFPSASGTASKRTNSRASSPARSTMFPDEPPQFFVRAPHGYFDLDLIQHDLRL